MMMRMTWGTLHQETWSVYAQAYNAIVVAKSWAMQGLQGRWLAPDGRDPADAPLPQ
jgi:hypothetical protein